MQLQTVLDTLHEYVCHVEAVAALLTATLHPALFVHDATLDNTVSDCLPHNILCIFFAVKMQFATDVMEGDTRVQEGELVDTCFNDILTEAADECTRLESSRCWTLCQHA